MSGKFDFILCDNDSANKKVSELRENLDKQSFLCLTTEEVISEFFDAFANDNIEGLLKKLSAPDTFVVKYSQFFIGKENPTFFFKDILKMRAEQNKQTFILADRPLSFLSRF